MSKRRGKPKLLNSRRLVAHEDQVTYATTFDPIRETLSDPGKAMVETGRGHSLELRIKQVVGHAAGVVLSDLAQQQAALFQDTLEETQEILDDTRAAEYAGYMDEFVHELRKDAADDLRLNRRSVAQQVNGIVAKPVDSAPPPDIPEPEPAKGFWARLTGG